MRRHYAGLSLLKMRKLHDASPVLRVLTRALQIKMLLVIEQPETHHENSSDVTW